MFSLEYSVGIFCLLLVAFICTWPRSQFTQSISIGGKQKIKFATYSRWVLHWNVHWTTQCIDTFVQLLWTRLNWMECSLSWRGICSWLMCGSGEVCETGDWPVQHTEDHLTQSSSLMDSTVASSIERPVGLVLSTLPPHSVFSFSSTFHFQVPFTPSPLLRIHSRAVSHAPNKILLSSHNFVLLLSHPGLFFYCV